MEHLLIWSKCSIFNNTFKSIQNLSFFLNCHDLKVAYGVKGNWKPKFKGNVYLKFFHCHGGLYKYTTN